MISKFRYAKSTQNGTKTKVCNGANSETVKTVNNDDNVTGCARLLDINLQQSFRELFSQLQFSNESSLPPDALRKALSESFSDPQRFQLGFMDDAAECFENILLRLHINIAHDESQDMCNAQHCIPHQKFAMTLTEQTVCGSCRGTSEPFTYTQMVHYVSTSTLVYQVRNGNTRGLLYSQTSFGQLLRKAGNMGDVRMCPNQCGAVVQISRMLMNSPEIVSIGLVWNSERPSLEHIMEVFSTIGTSILLGDIFTSGIEKKWNEESTHNLVGIVTYYGKHYSTFFFHTKLRVWIYFDDATVRQVGPHWEQVVEKCRKGRYQPLLLLYAAPVGTPINTETAPKVVTQICSLQSSPKKTSLSQNYLRRSITPSPEKPNIGNTRRAITPNPDCLPNQKPPLPKSYNEYQNLSVIQNNLRNSSEGPDIYAERKEPYVRKLDMDAVDKPVINIHRTLSNGSSSGIDGMSDHMNFPRRRDSGNWSGDRNSASSASSTTMENPYLYLIGKIPQNNVPDSPTLVKSDSSSTGSPIFDAGYDSYSLSSNDSSTMNTLQHMMKIGHLAKIPEDYNNTPSQITKNCDVLCDEADELLVKSRQLEDEHDLVLALALCNAAATKARAAMNAPYNNPKTLTLARMKHNTCIMRARSLHRRMTQTPPQKDSIPPDIRHTKEGNTGRHSRQNSRDKTHSHSRQNSKELLTNIPQPEKIVPKNIEIYATLPKRKDLLKSRLEAIQIDDTFALNISKEKESPKESGFFSRSKQKDKREKRSRSEDRSKQVEFTLIPDMNEISSKEKETQNKQEKDNDKKSKKQHKIRRKLLMGGLIKRKNRSMPDLTDNNPDIKDSSQSKISSADDSKVGLKESVISTQSSMSGYLSEGHLEFSTNSTNPNLKKSKLMRKGFYSSTGKILSVPKIPPPPPLRTTSQLSASKLQTNSDGIKTFNSEYQNLYELSKYDTSMIEKLNCVPIIHRLCNDTTINANIGNTNLNGYRNHGTTLITTADVHRESTGSREQLNTKSVDEVDCFPIKNHLLPLDLPPYPSPTGSTVHSRQSSEEFPPPPPPLDLSALDEHLPSISNRLPTSHLSNQISYRQKQMCQIETVKDPIESNPNITGGDSWLKELQAKQAALKIKRYNEINRDDDNGIDVVNTQHISTNIRTNPTLVKDLTSKFEKKETDIATQPTNKVAPFTNSEAKVNLSKKPDIETIAPEQIAEEIREVEKINATLQETLNSSKLNVTAEEFRKTKLGKKKSVSFCDQVTLVATAEDQEDDSYIPNPILERVLRSAINVADHAESDIKSNSNLPCDNTSKEDNDTSSENLFDITMRNTLENSKTSTPVLLKINNPDTQRSAVSVQDPPVCYTSLPISSSINASLGAMPNTSSANQTTQLHKVQNLQHRPHLPQQPQRNEYLSNENYRVYSSNHADQMPYNNIVPQYLPQPAPPQQQPVYSGMLHHQTPVFNNGHGYNYAIHPQQQIQRYYNNPEKNFEDNCNHDDHYQQKMSPEHSAVPSHSQYAHQIQNISNQSIYSSPPQVSYGTHQSYSKPYGIESHNNVPQGYGGLPGRPNYQHPPQPLKPCNNQFRNNGIYQSVPFPMKQQQPSSVYQRVPSTEYNMNQNVNSPYQRLPSRLNPGDLEQQKYDPYQTVPLTHTTDRDAFQQSLPNGTYYSPNMSQMKSDSRNLERNDSAMSKAVVTPILVNNANNSIPDKTKCNLCRKKIVASSNLYCVDCEYYMSRFKPKT